VCRLALTSKKLKKSELYAKLVAENIAHQLERTYFFPSCNQASLVPLLCELAPQGIRIEVAGRLNGAEMSRREKEVQGSVPLHTLRADIDYALATGAKLAPALSVLKFGYTKEKTSNVIAK
jgi:small subunit ribosomal protein S3